MLHTAFSKKKTPFVVNYSLTGCSFDNNLVNFRCNTGILTNSLSEASGNLLEQVPQFISYSIAEVFSQY